jgi:hypothetical protein
VEGADGGEAMGPAIASVNEAHVIESDVYVPGSNDCPSKNLSEMAVSALPPVKVTFIPG